ncbi:MAG: helix-turn-helix domain-containing protein [Lacipirellulaceae bacterium]
MTKPIVTAVEQELIDGLEGFVADLESNAPIASKYTCRRVVLDLAPQRYGQEEVKQVRGTLGVSQKLFAQFLGVSLGTVRKWEQGESVSDIAARFMDEIATNPDYWKARLNSMIRVKHATTESSP